MAASARAARCSRSSCGSAPSSPSSSSSIAFSLLSPEFLTTGNLAILVKHVAINAILAIGMTFVILSGGIDLSVGSIVGLCGMIAGGLLSRGLELPALGGVVFVHTWLVVRDHPRGRHGPRRGERLARVTAARPALHRHARAALRGARRGAPDVGRRHVPEPRGRPALGNTGLPVIGAGTCRGCRFPSG